jgi:uncharacterized protein YbjQ (UPF0145 family)
VVPLWKTFWSRDLWVIGDVVGVVARTRELRPDLRGGNPIDGYVVMLTDSRQDAVARMVEMAGSGSDAVVGLRFDCSEITQSLSEVAAYGTAVRLTPDTVMQRATSGEQAATESEGADPSGDDDSMQTGRPAGNPLSRASNLLARRIKR